MTGCVMGIDPGPEQSGYAIVYGPMCIEAAVLPNEELLIRVERFHDDSDERVRSVAIEMIASYGMPVGKEVFDTCVFIGRLWGISYRPPILIYRKEVVKHLCGTAKGKDANVRQALLDMFPRTGGGKTPQVGTKKKPGPLFGFNSHMWPALGVAITARDTK